MKIFRVILFFSGSLFFIPSVSEGQNITTSHLIWNLPAYNVGSLTPSNISRITFDYRVANLAEGVSFSSASAWMDYPILYRDKNEGAFFLMFENERSGGKIDFNTIKVSAALAKRIAFSKTSFITFGLGAGYQQFGLSLDGLSTSSQYIDGIGFDPSLPNGESSGYYRTSYITINSGLFYQATNFSGNRLLRIGLSAHNLNKQLKTWGDQGTPLPVQWSSQLQYLIFTRTNFATGPDFELFREGENFNGFGGWSFRFYINEEGNKPLKEETRSYVNLFARAATQEKGILGIQITNGKWIAGFSYDFPFGKLSKVYGNVFEILFALTPEVHSRERQKQNKSKQGKPGPEKGKTPKSQDPEKKKVIPPVQALDSGNITTDSTSVNQPNQEGKITVGGINSEETTINPRVNPVYFISGSSEMDASSKEHLEKVYSAWIKNGEYRVIITGHTDDVGSRENNLGLSLKRAKKASEYLEKLGLPAENITLEGKGEEEPLVPNDSAEGRARNRRVEIILIRK